MALQSDLPGVTLGRVAVLNDSMVLLRADITTVMQLFDLARHEWSISYKAVAS